MPEAPDVHYQILFLHKFVGKTLDIKTDIVKLTKIWESLTDRKLTNVSCKGKLIYFQFGDQYILNHLMLEGWWSATEEPYHRATILENGKPLAYFSDKIHLAHFELTDRKELDERLSLIGPDVMTDEFTKEVFKKACDRKKKISTLIMDQDRFSGIGNYLRSEILYDADVKYDKKGSDLTDDEITRLYKSIKRITKHVYDHLVKDVDAPYPFKVYRQDKTPDGKKVKKIAISGRSLYTV